jgi:dihydroflavonol-4-reductase
MILYLQIAPSETGSGKRVLVTGASGFIGTHLVPRLAALGFEVSTFGRSSGKPHFESLGVAHICGDVTNYRAGFSCHG